MLNLEFSNGSDKHLAEYLLVTMVRGITTGLRFPFASYATSTANGTSLYTILWESVEYIELVAGLKVLYICCDGAVQNLKFFQMHSQANDKFRKREFVCNRRQRNIVLTNHLNQDPLERLFGHCRQKGGSNQNPTVKACHAINTIRAGSAQACKR